jgi:sialate O-acetylesterase
MRFFVSLLLLLSVAIRGARADVVLAPWLADHAVLQRGKPIPIWGRAEPGEKISVTFLDQRLNVTTGPDGRWIVFLDAREALSEGADLIVAGRNTLTLRDVVVGEIWLCGGPASLEIPPPKQLVLSALNSGPGLPVVRQLRIQASATPPADSVRAAEWQSFATHAPAENSSIGLSFARDLSQKLGVPVGLIQVSATAPLEAWLAPAALAPELVGGGRALRESSPGSSVIVETPRTVSPAAGTVFNGTIQPLLPFAFQGVLWRESSAPVDAPDSYRVLFPAVIASWRAQLAQGDFPFYWVELPANRKVDRNHAGRLALHREAQAAALVLPNTGQAAAIDLLTDSDAVEAGVAQTVGRRLALLAKNRVYGIVVDDAGPRFAAATREGAGMRVRLSHATSGLVAHEKPVQSLELAGADRVFRPASARIERESLLVTSPEVRAPVAVRYAWRDAPEANLYSGAGQPVEPFRSDNW